MLPACGYKLYPLPGTRVPITRYAFTGILQGRRKGDLDEALNIMETLEEIDPDNPVFLFNLSSLMLEMGEVEKAREYFNRIDDQEFEKEFAKKLKISGKGNRAL